ncbi:MAG: glycosyltransferase family 2 protein [Verrucomicrobiota bacterium]
MSTPSAALPQVSALQYRVREPAPRISVVVPNYNGEATLETTLRSILDQGYSNLELIVVDGGSTDGSVEIIKRYQDRLAYWVSQKDDGQYHAINHGFEQATGEVLAWLNSDDVHYPWTLRAVGKIFDENPEVEWIMGRPNMMVDGVLTMVMDMQPRCRELLRAGLYSDRTHGVVQQESCFWRRGLWEKAGGLDLQYSLAGDFELWTRFARHAELVTTDMLLGTFCFHGENRSSKFLEEYCRQQGEVIANLPPEEARSRQKLQRDLEWLHRVRNKHFSKKLVRGVTGLRKLRAPVLHFHANYQEGRDESHFMLKRRKLF